MPKDDSAAPGRAWLDAALRTIGRSALADKMALCEDEYQEGYRAIGRWLEGTAIDAASAWVLGEAIGREEAGFERIRGVSGPVGLYWFEHLADLVGVLACSDRRTLAAHGDRLKEMLRALPATTHLSPFDGLVRGDHEIFTAGTVRPEALRSAADFSGAAREFDAAAFAAEAEALTDRNWARALWTMPADLSACLEAGARRWFGGFASGSRTPRATRAGKIREARLTAAHAVAESAMPYDAKTTLVVEALESWLKELRSERPAPLPPES